MSKVYGSIVEYLALAGGVLVFLMSILTTADIIGREVVEKAVPGCYELVQLLMIPVVFFAIAHLESKKGNVRVEIVATRFTERGQMIVSLVASIIGLFIFGVFLWSTSIWGWESWVEREPMQEIRGWPLYLWKFCVPIGCFFMCMELAIGIVGTIKRLTKRDRA